MSTRAILLKKSVYSLFIPSFFLFLFLFFLTTPENHTEAEDAFEFAFKVEKGELKDLIHPNHLIYLLLMRGFYFLIRQIGLVERAYPLMVFLSSIFGSLTVTVFISLLQNRLRIPYRVSILGGTLLAVSYGFWRYSCEAEIYTLACLGIVILLYYAFNDRITYTNSVLSGSLAGLSYLFHSLSVIPAFITVPIFFLLNKKIRHLVVYLLVGFSIILPCYYIAYQIVEPGDISFLQFFRGAYGVKHNLSISEIIANIIKAVVVFGQTLVSGNFLFSYIPFQELMSNEFPYRMLGEEQFMGIKAAEFSKIIPPTTLTMLASLALVSSFVIKNEICKVLAKVSKEKEAIAIAVWVLIYIVLIVPFEPDAPELWIVGLIPFWLLSTRFFLVPLYKKQGIVLPFLLLIFMIMHNYLGGFALINDKQGDYNYQKATWLVQNAGVKDFVLTAERASFTRYLKYYCKAPVIELQEFSNPKLAFLYKGLENVPAKAYIDEFSNLYRGLDNISGKVYATAEFFSPPKYLMYSRPNFNEALKKFGKDVSNEFNKLSPNEFGGIYVKKVGLALRRR